MQFCFLVRRRIKEIVSLSKGKGISQLIPIFDKKF